MMSIPKYGKIRFWPINIWLHKIGWVLCSIPSLFVLVLLWLFQKNAPVTVVSGTDAPGGVKDVVPPTGFHATRNGSHGNLTGARWITGDGKNGIVEQLCNFLCKLYHIQTESNVDTVALTQFENSASCSQRSLPSEELIDHQVFSPWPGLSEPFCLDLAWDFVCHLRSRHGFTKAEKAL